MALNHQRALKLVPSLNLLTLEGKMMRRTLMRSLRSKLEASSVPAIAKSMVVIVMIVMTTDDLETPMTILSTMMVNTTILLPHHQIQDISKARTAININHNDLAIDRVKLMPMMTIVRTRGTMLPLSKSLLPHPVPRLQNQKIMENAKRFVTKQIIAHSYECYL